MKKKVGLIVFAVILALLILFAIIYTWPRTLDSLINEKDPTSLLFAYTRQMNFEDFSPKNEMWKFSEEQQSDPAVIAEVMELAGQIKYRRSLRSLLSPNSFSGNYTETIRSSTTLSFVFEDNSHITLDHLGIAVGISLPDKKGFVLATVVNEEALAALTDYIKENAAEHEIN